MDVLQERQIKLEEEAVGLGKVRYWKTVASQGTDRSTPGRVLMREALAPYAESIRQWMETSLAGRANRSASVVKFAAQFDPEELALVAMSRVINVCGQHDQVSRLGGVNLVTVATKITSVLEDSVNIERLREEAPKLMAYLERKNRTSAEKNRHIAIRRAMKFIGVEQIRWTASERVRLGTALLHMLQESTGLIQIRTVTMRNRRTTVVALSDSAHDWLAGSHARCEILSPLHMPMVVPPRPWTTIDDGGYLTPPLRLKVLKMAGDSKRVRRRLSEYRNSDMEVPYGALNALQDTPWRINRTVLGVMRTYWDMQRGVAGLPVGDSLPLPPVTHDVEDKAAHRLWRVRASRVHAENVRRNSKRLATASMLWVAEKFADEQAFYFPHSLDWRGRAYAHGHFLNPQGDDRARSLLTLATAVPLGEFGMFWLQVHGANLYGVDKVSFAQRVQWVTDNEAMIMRFAAEAEYDVVSGDREEFWEKADKPWQFLAWALEYARLKQAQEILGIPEEKLLSSLPVALDGTCNGLQNLSMLMRDEEGGRSVNLVASDEPADIYQAVANTANRILKDSSDPLAKLWLDRGGVTRKLAKRPTMTLPYGAKRYGFSDQLRQTLTELDDGYPGSYLGVTDPTEALNFLAGVLWDAIGGTVGRARAAMDWLQEVSKVVAFDGLPIRWTAPSGMMVIQDYRQLIGKQLDFVMGTTRYQLTLAIEGDRLDKRKQSNGISPNFIHSLDASHMMMTILECKAIGIKDFAMVHDSYGSQAGNIQDLSIVLREVFIQIYREPVLERFREEVLSQLSDPDLRDMIPPVPEKGTLDPLAVRDSLYFFA